MSRDHRATFSSRASLFASPGDSSVIPRKKVARGSAIPAPIFTEVAEKTRVAAKKTPEQIPVNTEKSPQKTQFIEDDVEPMEVDGTIVPSPAKVQCSKAATPRRKSLMTPGKRLCITSKTIENEHRKADDSTHYEVLMDKKDADLPKFVKKVAEDNAEMKKYLGRLEAEIEDINAVQKNRESLLKRAVEISNGKNVSSIVPNQKFTFDMTARKEESSDDTVRKLHGIFLKNTQDAGEQKLALKKADHAEITYQNLQSKLKRLEDAKKNHEAFQVEQLSEYKKLAQTIEENSKSIQELDGLFKKLRPIPIFF